MRFLISLMMLSALGLALSSCNMNFSVGTETDLRTGLTVNYDGLSMGDVYLSVNDRRLDSNKVPYGSTIVLQLQEVEGFRDIDGKVYPGASILLTAPDGTVLLEMNDMFEQYDSEGLSETDARYINLSFTSGSPMDVGIAYKLSARVWDKKDLGKIEAEVELILE